MMTACLLFACQGRQRVLGGYEPAGDTRVYSVPAFLLPVLESLRKDGCPIDEAMLRLGVQPDTASVHAGNRCADKPPEDRMEMPATQCAARRRQP